MEPNQSQTSVREKESFDPRSIPGAIIIASVIIAGSILLVGFRGETKTEVTKTTELAPKVASQTGVLPMNESDHVRGERNARFVLIEFSDFECPYCKVFHSTLKRLMDEHGPNGTLAWVYRNFPIDSLHKKARSEAVAAECAALVGGNDIYWAYIDELFKRTNSNDSLDPNELPKIASDVGLDVLKFNSCIESGDANGKIEADIKDGVTAGLRGTPYSILIDTKTGKEIVVNGAQTYEWLKNQIESGLK